jgi:hypothetical protein
LRSFDYIQGVTLPVIIFNGTFERNIWRINEIEVQNLLRQGKAYQHVSGELVRDLDERTKEQVIDVYVTSMRMAWIGAAAFSAVGTLLVLVEKHVPFRTKVDSAYRIEKSEKREALEVTYFAIAE